MRARRLPIVPLAVLMSAVSALSASADGRLTLSGDRVRIYNLAGKYEVVPGTSKSVIVDYVSFGKDASQVDVKTGNEQGTSWLAFAYPGTRILFPRLSSGSSTEMWVREDGRFGGKESRSNARKVRIVGSGSGAEAWADLKVQVPPGQEITLYLGVGEANVSNIDGKLRVDCATADVATTGTAGSLSIDTGSGDVSVREAKGSVAIDTGSGDVEATKLDCDNLAVDTGSGSIRITDATARNLALDTGSGDVDCDRVTSDNLAVDTGSGSVGIDLTRDVHQLAIDTGSGNVTISAPGTLGATVLIETGSGRISTDFPLTIRRKDDDSVRGTIGDGQGQIMVETGSGDVRLVKRGS